MTLSFRDLIFQITFRMIILATIIHEYGHLLALRVMNYRGYIHSNTLNMVTALEFNTMSLREQRFFFFSGGLFQCLMFLAMCIFDKDEEDRLVNKMVAIQGIIYAFFEAFTYRMWWQFGTFISILFAFGFMVLVLVAKNKINP